MSTPILMCAYYHEEHTSVGELVTRCKRPATTIFIERRNPSKAEGYCDSHAELGGTYPLLVQEYAQIVTFLDQTKVCPVPDEAEKPPAPPSSVVTSNIAGTILLGMGYGFILTLTAISITLILMKQAGLLR